MRTFGKIILLSTLTSLSMVACGGSEEEEPGGTGGGSSGGSSSGGSSSGGTGSGGTSSGGSGSGGTGALGGGGSLGGGGATMGTVDRSCDSVAVAKGETGAGGGVIELIDDFEGGSFLSGADSRDGYWVAASFLTPESEMNTTSTDPTLVDDGDNKYLSLTCSTDPACSTSWDKETPYQWSAASVRFVNLDGVACYDASIYSGIQFKARGGSAGQKLRVQMNTPGDDRENNNSFNSMEFELTEMWADYTVTFADIKLKSGVSLDAKELESISFVVRNVTREASGESLLPYDIHLDDVQFTR